MSDFVLQQVTPRQQTVGLGAAVVALLIVAALVVAAVRITADAKATERPLLLDPEPAGWSGFTA